MESLDLDALVAWVKETDRPETKGQLLIPSVDKPSFGPNVPIIGAIELAEHASGLVAPILDEDVPADLVTGFASWRVLSGDEISLPAIKEVVARNPWLSMVVGIAKLNRSLEARNPLDPELRERLLSGWTPDQIRAHVAAMLDDEGYAFTSPQVLLATLKLAIAYGGAEKDGVNSTGLGPLILAVADHIGSPVEGPGPTFELELARCAIFFSRRHFVRLWGRADLLWHDLA